MKRHGVVGNLEGDRNLSGPYTVWSGLYQVPECF